MKKYKYISYKIRRIVRFEFWHYLIFYFPMFIYGLFLAILEKSLMYFSTANPDMLYGGVMGESKYKILLMIPLKYIPNTMLVHTDVTTPELNEMIKTKGFTYPMIVKPNRGERGRGVELVNDPWELAFYRDKYVLDVIIQEYVDYKEEFGILYYRYPGEAKGHISSVIRKKFLEVTGDGIQTLEALIDDHPRARPRREYLFNKYKDVLYRVVPKGKKIVLEPIGNHSRGTKFFDCRDLVNDQLIAVFDKIASQIDNFYYGRFDIKVTSLDDLYKGKNIRIMELNGVSSEPAHIYHPGYRLMHAYKDVIQHMRVIRDIARLNYLSGYPRAPFKAFYSDLIDHIKRSSAFK